MLEEARYPVLLVGDREMRMCINNPLYERRPRPRTSHDKDIGVLTLFFYRIIYTVSRQGAIPKPVTAVRQFQRTPGTRLGAWSRCITLIVSHAPQPLLDERRAYTYAFAPQDTPGRGSKGNYFQRTAPMPAGGQQSHLAPSAESMDMVPEARRREALYDIAYLYLEWLISGDQVHIFWRELQQIDGDLSCERKLNRFYSYRSASIGSRKAALRAG